MRRANKLAFPWVQAGRIAKNNGLEEELILAAFLLDIGHLVPLSQQVSD